MRETHRGYFVADCVGKTLTGVTAAQTIKKSVVCLATNAVSVLQVSLALLLTKFFVGKMLLFFRFGILTPPVI